MSSVPPILQFTPIYKDKIWGGKKLKSIFGRQTPEGNIGESWEVSDYGKDVSVTSNTNYPGKSFREIYQSNTKEILGPSFSNQSFPLLVKIIDAREKLSVQVHPDDAYAEKYDPVSSGKKECWLVLAAEPGAELVVGFEKDTDKQTYAELVKKNQAEEVLRRWEVKPGDVFLLNPGTIHAIGAGVVLLEVQQSSDSTYRVYDYGRLGDDGKPRDLHLEKALAVLKFQKSDGSEKQGLSLISHSPFSRYLCTSNDKFRLETWVFSQGQFLPLFPLSDPVSFGIAYVIQGEVSYPEERLSFKKGDSFFLTADAFQKGALLSIAPDTKIAFMSAGADWVNW
ncbi:mannose-6-phosphate isomerase [Leptospira kobayashii]|uniref:Mannose-6-phosphate isomerase n=1 Tax=Leptospira kobayashii TaxID=1917830 RepID=A0ABN6KCR9_9LEPT|nr:type I phosphomannose isomerase catalytic subunit [Leptospira kobayashii]BDA77406.1 mannose-6-phosphate isomerase [Leptospira kobayashii]